MILIYRAVPSDAENRLRQALNNLDPDLERKVERVFRRWNNLIRDCLRSEMALRLSTEDHRRSVPIKISPYVPAPLVNVVADLDPLVLQLLPHLPTLRTTLSGLQLLIDTFERPERNPAHGLGLGLPPKVAEVNQFCRQLVEALENFRQQTLKNLRQKLEEKQKPSYHQIMDEFHTPVRESDWPPDILGRYLAARCVIELYWPAIGLVSRLIGVDAESLTVVVMIHELAHAYSHVGMDIDGGRWPDKSFAECDPKILEGIAQFYTDLVCRKLQSHLPTALEAFEELLKWQSQEYNDYKEWLKATDGTPLSPERFGEVVRAALVECRKNGITQYSAFCFILKNAGKRLGIESLTRSRPSPSRDDFGRLRPG